MIPRVFGVALFTAGFFAVICITGFTAEPVTETTTLYDAADSGQIEVVKRLIASGTNVNEAEKELGVTPLMAAAYRGRLDIVDVLLANGADPKAKTNNGKPVLHFAMGGRRNRKVVQTLIDHGAGERVTGTISNINKNMVYEAKGYGFGMTIKLKEYPNWDFFINRDLAISSGLIWPQVGFDMMKLKVDLGTKVELVFYDAQGYNVVFAKVL